MQAGRYGLMQRKARGGQVLVEAIDVGEAQAMLAQACQARTRPTKCTGTPAKASRPPR